LNRFVRLVMQYSTLPFVLVIAALTSHASDTGNASETMTTGEAFVHRLGQGGVTMLALLLLSVTCVGFALERSVRLRRSRVVPPHLAPGARKLWSAGEHDQLINLCRKDGSVTAGAIAEIAANRHRTEPRVSAIAADVASRGLKRQLQRAYPLAVIATIAPLLGLLGTIIGMIGAFEKVSLAGEMADASLFGGDIAKALITTGAGLVIAIPALALYHFFRSRTHSFGLEVEETVSRLLLEWFDDDSKSAESETSDDVAPESKSSTAKSEGKRPVHASTA